MSDISDLGVFDLSAATSVTDNSFDAANAPTPDGANAYGELFTFALAHEGLDPMTAPFAKRLFFPVNPEEFSWGQTRAIGTYDILNARQAIQLGNLQVRTFNISSFFPYEYDDEFCAPVPNRTLDKTPIQSLDWLVAAQRSGLPLQFWSLPHRDAPSFFGNVKVVISNLQHSLRAGNPLDLFFELEMTELIEPTIIRTSAVLAPTWLPANHKYITKKGETLIDVTRACYGAKYGGLFKQIQDKNVWIYYPKHVRHHLRRANRKLVTNPRQILLPGQHLLIPKPKAPPVPR